MKIKIKRVFSLILATILLFNSGIYVVIANDNTGDYDYGSFAIVKRDQDNKLEISSGSNSLKDSEKVEESKIEEPKKEEKVEEPKIEEPKKEEKVEEPKIEEPKKEEKVEEPKVEEPKKEEKVEEPKVEEPKKEGKVEEPKVEEPKKEEKVEEPKVEEPKKEEKVEEPKVEESKKEEKVEEPKVEEPKKEEKVEEPKVEEPKKEEKVEEPKVEEPKKEEKVEEPKVEEPKKEEKVEEPKVEEPKKEEKVEESKVEEPKKEEKVEEPKVEEPKKEEKVEEPKVEEPKKEEKAEEPKVEKNETEDTPLSILLQDEKVIATLSRAGRTSTRTSRGVTSRSGSRERIIEDNLNIVDIEITNGLIINEEENIPDDIEEQIDGEILKYITITGNESDVEDAVITFLLDKETKEDIVLIYITPSGDLEEITPTDLGNGQYQISLESLESESRVVKPAATEIIEEIPFFFTLNRAVEEVEPEEVNNFDSDVAIDESELAYFNANIFNYDARKFNFATRALQLHNSGIGSSAIEAAGLLENAGDTSRTSLYTSSVPSHAEAADYARRSTKGSLLFNFSAIDEHYTKSQYYDEWLAQHVKSTTRSWFEFNKPLTPQNNWTNQLITQGIVGSKGTTLTQAGLPNFQYTEAGLFKTKSDATRIKVPFKGTTEEWLIEERLNLRFPFKKLDNGYYEFNSETMYIDNVLSKESGDKIQLFEDSNAPQVGSKRRGFWPFATDHDFTKYLNDGQSTGPDEDEVSEEFLSDQYHFGMNLEARFVIPENRKVNGSDMIFEFTGDDDLWIYIDDHLALDVGGCHKALGGKINFTDGTITYFDPSDTPGTTAYDAAILTMPTGDNNWNSTGSGDKIFAKDSALTDETTKQTLDEKPTVVATTDTSWNLYSTLGLNEADFFEGSVHSIKIFYLERGTGQSNCRMKFNMSTISDIETEKTAYVYDTSNETRELNLTDSFAYTGQDVYFTLGLNNNSGQILNDVVLYDKELDLLFDENGIVENVGLESSTEQGIYEELNDTTFSDYSYRWSDDGDISNCFDSLAKNATIKITEDGVKIGSILADSVEETYGNSEDKNAIKDILTRTTPKYILKSDNEENTMYAIGRCDTVAFGKEYVGNFDDIQYKVKDTELYVMQVVMDESGNFVSNPKDAMFNTISDKDERNLVFESNLDEYKKYTSYYHNEEYDFYPVIPNDYELIAVDIRDTLPDFSKDDTELKNKDNYNNVDWAFEYTGEQYKKYITVLLVKKGNNNWHNQDAILNKFKQINIEGKVIKVKEDE